MGQPRLRPEDPRLARGPGLPQPPGHRGPNGTHGTVGPWTGLSSPAKTWPETPGSNKAVRPPRNPRPGRAAAYPGYPFRPSGHEPSRWKRSSSRTVGDNPVPLDPLSSLTAWYTCQCDGDWEHEYGIRIETLGNPGWSVEIERAAKARELPAEPSSGSLAHGLRGPMPSGRSSGGPRAESRSGGRGGGGGGGRGGRG
ncbi:Imm53 family immunity protein [Streptomyces sp. NPDC093097]|uniref:Imm53 family immunity protein n=1 Tax=Streptomyces sp. NPDC093097 TaxID=3366027 RepID=UPI0037FAFB2C